MLSGDPVMPRKAEERERRKDGTTETQTAKRNADGRGQSRDGRGDDGRPERAIEIE